MALQPESTDRPIAASLKATYRALLARWLETGEATNLRAFLPGPPSAGFKWTLPEIEAITPRRLMHAADQRAASAAAIAGAAHRPTTRQRRASTDPRRRRSGSTHVIDPPAA